MTFTWTGNAGDGLSTMQTTGPRSRFGNTTPGRRRSRPTLQHPHLLCHRTASNSNRWISPAAEQSRSQAGSYPFKAITNVTMVPGTTLDTGGGTLNAASGISFGGGAGSFTIQDATVFENLQLTVGSSQTFVLDHSSYSSSSGIDGPGTLQLTGSTLTMVSARALRPHRAFHRFFRRYAQRHQPAPFPPNVSSISNLGFGTTIKSRRERPDAGVVRQRQLGLLRCRATIPLITRSWSPTT